MLKIWNGLQTDIQQARWLLAQGTLSEGELAQIPELSARMQAGINEIQGIDFEASAKNTPNSTFGAAVAKAMLATAKKAEEILGQFQQPLIEQRNDRRVAVLTTLASAAAIAVAYALLPKVNTQRLVPKKLHNLLKNFTG